MAKAPTRASEADNTRPPTEPSPLEKMKELTRKILHVRKDELPNKGQMQKRQRH
jgi:hypothetical protein